jgi:hypothetical protein
MQYFAERVEVSTKVFVDAQATLGRSVSNGADPVRSAILIVRSCQRILSTAEVAERQTR